MTDNTTPRELSADELERMRERAQLNGAQPFDTYTIRALLAHVASVDARCRAYEAALIESVPRTKPGRAGFVYLVQSSTGYYKIGRTSDPNNRMKTFSVKLPFEVSYACVIETVDMKTLEQSLHEQFAGKRVNGEWFALDAADVEYIRGLAS